MITRAKDWSLHKHSNSQFLEIFRLCLTAKSPENSNDFLGVIAPEILTSSGKKGTSLTLFLGRFSLPFLVSRESSSTKFHSRHKNQMIFWNYGFLGDIVFGRFLKCFNIKPQEENFFHIRMIFLERLFLESFNIKRQEETSLTLFLGWLSLPFLVSRESRSTKLYIRHNNQMIFLERSNSNDFLELWFSWRHCSLDGSWRVLTSSRKKKTSLTFE